MAFLLGGAVLRAVAVGRSRGGGAVRPFASSSSRIFGSRNSRSSVAIAPKLGLRVAPRHYNEVPTVDKSGNGLERQAGVDGDLSEVDRARLKLARSANLAVLNSRKDLEDHRNSTKLLVVDYYAPWCRACRRLLQQIQKVALQDEFRSVEFASVDFEQANALCKHREIDKLPTLEIFAGGELEKRWSSPSKKKLLEQLRSVMAESTSTA